jgi:hypothetical protein
LNEVDFIAYRNDLDSGVKCGVVPQPLRVYVTWRDAGRPAAEKAVVAVEFLPDK